MIVAMIAKLTTLDITATTWINGLAGETPWLDALMRLSSLVGVPLMIAAVIASWWLGGANSPARRSARHAAVRSGLAFLLGLAINQLILLFLHRLRPYDAGISHLLIAPSADPSFPSDHATASFAIVLAYLADRRWRSSLLLGGMAMLVVTSRVFLGTHYVSDILGGIATALLAVTVTRASYQADTRLDRFITGIL